LMTASDIDRCRQFYHTAVREILGLNPEEQASGDSGLTGELIELLLRMRKEARSNKNFELADKIRDEMIRLGVEVKDTRDGFEWKLNR
jgi:cysteinyl-tRNA synthetase